VVEGTTEAAVFCGLGDKAAVGFLETNGVAIVAVGGKSTIPLAHAIVTSLGIPTYALFDGDGGFEARATANGKTHDKIDEEKASHVAANRAVLKYFGLAEVDFPSAQVADNVAIFDDHLEAFLGANWPEWVASCQTVEQTSGVTLSKNQLAYRAATLEAEGKTPEMLTQILAKVTGA
jgi:putative ATP-dependent endonuclease of OLD family